MIKISMHEFVHHLADYVIKAEQGEKIVVMKRNKPAVQISHYNEHVQQPSWKNEFVPVKIKGAPLSKTIIEMRRKK